jgi:hypothetical protein
VWLCAQSIESEGRDRTSIDFPGVQTPLLQAVLAAQPNTVLVLVNGGSLDVSWAAQHVPAIVEAFYPGEEGGNAVADLLFGLYSPSGRLPITLYPAAFTEQISMFSMEMREAPGKTYRFYTDEPVYPFGYGLSYTEFEYSIVGPSSAGSSLPTDGRRCRLARFMSQSSRFNRVGAWSCFVEPYVLRSASELLTYKYVALVSSMLFPPSLRHLLCVGSSVA